MVDIQMKKEACVAYQDGVSSTGHDMHVEVGGVVAYWPGEHAVHPAAPVEDDISFDFCPFCRTDE